MSLKIKLLCGIKYTSQTFYCNNKFSTIIYTIPNCFIFYLYICCKLLQIYESFVFAPLSNFYKQTDFIADYGLNLNKVFQVITAIINNFESFILPNMLTIGTPKI